jgi:hypothetical protein
VRHVPHDLFEVGAGISQNREPMLREKTCNLPRVNVAGPECDPNASKGHCHRRTHTLSAVHFRRECMARGPQADRFQRSSCLSLCRSLELSLRRTTICRHRAPHARISYACMSLSSGSGCLPAVSAQRGPIWNGERRYRQLGLRRESRERNGRERDFTGAIGRNRFAHSCLVITKSRSVESCSNG